VLANSWFWISAGVVQGPFRLYGEQRWDENSPLWKI